MFVKSKIGVSPIRPEFHAVCVRRATLAESNAGAARIGSRDAVGAATEVDGISRPSHVRPLCRVANGCAMLPGLASLPVGATKYSAAYARTVVSRQSPVSVPSSREGDAPSFLARRAREVPITSCIGLEAAGPLPLIAAELRNIGFKDVSGLRPLH